MKVPANPTPASRPSITPLSTGERGARASSCGSPGASSPEETSQIPGTATTSPSSTSRPNRSPIATPNSTGSTAAPTPDSGATTLIRPAANPRKRKLIPTPDPTPGRDRPGEVGARRGRRHPRRDQEQRDRAGALHHEGHRPRRRTAGDDATDEVRGAVRGRAEQGEQQRDHVCATPTTQSARARKPAVSSTSIASPTAVSA